MLHPYQRKILRQLRTSQHRKVLVVLPMGTGKTFIACDEIRRTLRRKGRVLFLGHRVEMLDNVAQRLVDAGLSSADIGIIRGRDPRRNDQAAVQVASIMTLIRRANMDFDLLVIDEAHRAMSPSYQSVIRSCSSARILGLTATPIRLDGRPLGECFEELIEGPHPTDLVEEGYLSSPRIFVSSQKIDTTDIGVVGGDFDRASLAKRFNREQLAGDVVRDWRKHAGQRKTLVFAINVAHAKSLAARFVKDGVSATSLDGSASLAERADVLARLRRGELNVVVSCDLFNEGLDIPEIRCCVMARPTMSLGLYLQQCGRCMRPGPDQPIIMDHAGNVFFHRLMPTEAHGWELASALPKRAASLAFKRCKVCGAVQSRGERQCQNCNAAFAFSKVGEPQEDGTELREWTRSYTYVVDGEFFQSLREVARKFGVAPQSLCEHVNKRGRTIEQALNFMRARAARKDERIFALMKERGLTREEAIEEIGRESRRRNLEATPRDPKKAALNERIRAAAKSVGIQETTMRQRYAKFGEVALAMPRDCHRQPKPIAGYPTIKAFANANGVNPKSLARRIGRGFAAEDAVRQLKVRVKACVERLSKPQREPRYLYQGRGFSSLKMLSNAAGVSLSGLRSAMKASGSVEEAIQSTRPCKKAPSPEICAIRARARDLGIDPNLVSNRIRLGWTFDEAVSIAKRPSSTIRAWAALGIPRRTAKSFKQAGLTIEDALSVTPAMRAQAIGSGKPLVEVFKHGRDRLRAGLGEGDGDGIDSRTWVTH